MKRLDKTVLITGCGRERVGHSVAQHLASRGWNIAAHCHRSFEQAEQNVVGYRALGVEADVFQADLTAEEAVEQVVADVVGRFGAVDALLTTSSVWRAIPLDELTADEIMADFQVNTLSTFLCCQHVGLQMVKQANGGSIVTMGDALTSHPYVDYAAYFTAKGAIATMTRAMAVELGTRNPQVRANCIAPGPVLFPSDMSAEQKDWVVNSTLSKIADHPQSVALAVEFLINTPMMTGAVIPVDSGRNVGREQHMRSGLEDVP